MDNITHTLVGATLGQAGLKRMSGLSVAALAIGANLPDVDALAAFYGTHTLSARRGWTHGPVGLVVLPVLLTLLLVAFDNWQLRRGTRPLDRSPVRPRQLLLLSFLACLTHPLLDWLNTYGVRLLMPFSERWFYGDALQIIDPWVWLVLALGAFLSRRRDRAHRPDYTRPARTALALVSLYVVAMVAMGRSGRGIAAREMEASTGATPLRVMAGPVFFQPHSRGLVFDMGDHYRFGRLHWLPRPEVVIATAETAKNLDHPLARSAAERADIQRFLYWSRFPYFVIPADTGPAYVEVRDARFRGPRLGRNPFRLEIPVAELRGSTSDTTAAPPPAAIGP